MELENDIVCRLRLVPHFSKIVSTKRNIFVVKWTSALTSRCKWGTYKKPNKLKRIEKLNLDNVISNFFSAHAKKTSNCIFTAVMCLIKCICCSILWRTSFLVKVWTCWDSLSMIISIMAPTISCCSSKNLRFIFNDCKHYCIFLIYIKMFCSNPIITDIKRFPSNRPESVAIAR